MLKMAPVTATTVRHDVPVFHVEHRAPRAA